MLMVGKAICEALCSGASLYRGRPDALGTMYDGNASGDYSGAITESGVRK